MYIPHYYRLVKGVGKAETPLLAFDAALRVAGVGDYNLVKVSSILPANSVEKDKVDLQVGALLPIVYSYYTKLGGEAPIVAAVALGIPEDRDKVGVIMEISGEMDEHIACDRVRRMVIEAMQVRGNKAFDIKVVSSVIVPDKTLYTCVFAGVALW